MVKADQLPWTPQELAWFVHLLSDPHYFLSTEKLHVKMKNWVEREKIEAKRNDKWSSEFRNSFLDARYQPERCN